MAFAIYRKYRPATFNEVLGQELIVKILKEAARQDKISHAYLFAGPRGTGKTTTARLIAKISNCETRASDESFKKTGEPCNACNACREIDYGTYLDVIEIDAASNRGIDEIRNLKENVRVTPSSGQKKVFIIDEAHMLTKEAWNALLKTLEEPPGHVVIILATTEADRVPATISSRTQQFFFERITMKELSEKLARIAEKEKIRISKEAINLIASAAEGSFRDAESLLDQLISAGEKEISVGQVEQVVGNVGFETLSKFAGFILNKDLDGALNLLSKIQDEGHNIVQFTKDLLHYLRRTAVLHYSPGIEKLLKNELTKDHVKKISEHAKLFNEGHLEIIKSLLSAYSQMRYSPFPIIPLEVTIVEGLKK